MDKPYLKCRSERRARLIDLLDELSGFVCTYNKQTKGFNVDETFVLDCFVREVIRGVIPTRNGEGRVVPFVVLGQKEGHFSLEAHLAQDCVTEHIWPRVYVMLGESNDEVEAFLFRFAKTLIERQVCPVSSRIMGSLSERHHTPV